MMKDGIAQPQVWFLFGLSGSGKSYVGDLIARAQDWPVYHADDDITPAMRLALSQARPFTPAMRDEYFALLVDKILARKALNNGLPLVVTQGAYKQRSRDYLQQQMPGLAMVWIDAPDTLIAQRLQRRDTGITPASAAALRQDFELPAPGGFKIVNDDGPDRVLRQFADCLERWLTRPEQVI